MAQLFAAYLTQKMVPEPVSGAYDPEQELWIGDSRLQGPSVIITGTHTTKATFTNPGLNTDRDTGSDSDSDRDTDA